MLCAIHIDFHVHVSYPFYVHVHVHVHFSSQGERVRLDRRRLEAAHFKYAMLNATSWYPDDIKNVPIFSPNMDQVMAKFISVYQQAFHKKYSGTFYDCTHTKLLIHAQ